MPHRTMLVTNAHPPPGRGGRAMLSALLRESLAGVVGDELTVIELARSRVTSIGDRMRALRGELDGVDAVSVARVLGQIADEGVRTVVLDGSNLGALAPRIKARAPGVEVVTHFHNVEARFFAGALRHRPSAHALGVFLGNLVAERMAVRASDKLVCLTPRDRRLLADWYGREGTHVLPLAVRDLAAEGPTGSAAPTRGPYVLFVGGGFYANRAGIEWFVKHVAPRIQCETVIIGTGMEALRLPRNAQGQVRIVGAVDDLRPWYEHARLVVAPIFDGSGMKTKVAEGLMFGKRVVGTPDAFVGYEDDAESIGVVCSHAEGFVRAIALELASQDQGRYDDVARRAYERSYSPSAHRESLSRILASSPDPIASSL